MEIRKWSVYLADLSPRFGTEPGKLRPVVVIQTNLLNDLHHPSTLICPCTSKVFLEAKWLRVHLKSGEAGIDVKSDILVDQIRAIDNRRFKEKTGDLPRELRMKLRESMKAILDL